MESRQERINDIVGRGQDIVQLFQRWANSEWGGSIVPEDLANAIKLAFLVCNNGDVPQPCRELVGKAIPELYQQQLNYESGLSGLNPRWIENDKRPKSEWFVAMQGLMKALVGAKPKIRTPIEPMYVLIEGGASMEQIAFHICGRRGKGPFVLPNGGPNIAMIRQQAAAEKYEIEGQGKEVQRVKDADGVTIDASYEWPWEKEYDLQEQEELKNRLKAVQEISASKPKFQDPGTVESQLIDGQTCDYIAMDKGKTVPEVIREAVRLGLKPIFTPTYQQTAEDVQAMQMQPNAEVVKTDDQKALEALVIENMSAGGAPEIVAKLSEGNVKVSVEQVNAIVAEHRKKARKAAT